MNESLRQLVTGLRVLLVLTVVLGIGYPLVVLGVGRVVADDQRTGSMITAGGQVVGSSLIGQSYEGNAWFVGRPSAVDHDAQGSAGSNDGPNNADLVATIEQRRAEVAAREQVAPSVVPPDAVTASGSGLDPFVSPAYAEIQIPRVAAARGLTRDQVAALVAEHTHGRMLGFLGMPRVNVVTLNSALGAPR